MISPVAAKPVEKPLYLRLRDGRSITRMNAGTIMAQDGPAFWLAFPNGIDHPLFQKL